jgi:Tat protein secretion system quality control protein TatD with DNase activity
VKYVAEFVAQLRGVGFDEIAAVSFANANRVLGLE